MRGFRFAGLLALVFISGSLQAQTLPIDNLDPYIDNRVEVQQFPTTGAQIEAARHEVSTAISTEINRVVDAIVELDSTAVGREYVEAVDAASDAAPLTSAQQYMQDTRPRQNPFNDDRPAIPQHDGIDADIARQINDAVRDIFRSENGSELPTYQPPESDGTRTRLEDLMGRYGREIATLQGQLLLDEIQQRQLAQAIADAANDAIDDSNLDHSNLVKRIINRYVQIMIPSQELPIAGMWRMPPVEYSRSGACEIYTGDNGGMAPITEEEMPTYPLCGYEADDRLPFLTWMSREASYIPGTSNIYSPTSTVDIQIARDSNGATIRNVRTTHAVEYEVVAPDRIVVRESFIEEGGCSLYAEYVLTLAMQDETVCNITDIPPFEEPEDDPTVPPGESRTMRVGMPLYTDEAACDATNTPPDFDTVTLTGNVDGSLVLDYGSGSQTLYNGGFGYYEFDIGTGSARQHISLNLYDGGQQGNLSWMNRTDADSPECYVSRTLSVDGADSGENSDGLETPADNGSMETPVDTGSDDAFGVLVPGEYAVEWMALPGLCPDAMLPMAPQFETVLIGAPGDGSAILQSDDAQYELVMVAAGTYIGGDSDDSGRTDTSLTTTEPGVASFMWSFSDTSGQMCMAMAQLTKVG
jgi:hypothetical protein